MAEDRDKPTVHATLNDLDQGEKPTPFVFLVQHKRVTFPDVFAMQWTKGEEFLEDVQGKPNSYVLKKWLSAEDYKIVCDSPLSSRGLSELMAKVQDHYEMSMGNAGEGNASLR